MSEIISFGNLVNVLNSVRCDYHEHLKTIPQYEAFLLVESSTQKSVETLQGHVNSPAPSMAAEVISVLELARTKFKDHMQGIPEYRVLLAIDKLIDDVSIDLGVHPTLAQSEFPNIAIETRPQEIAPARSEPDAVVTATVHAAAQPEATEIAAPQELAATESDLAVSAAERLIAQPKALEIVAPQEEVAANEAGLAVAAAEHVITQSEAAEIFAQQRVAATEVHVAGSAAKYPIMQPEVGETVSAQEDAALDGVFAASAVEHTITQPVAVEITATPLPAAPFDDGSERAA